MSAERRQFLRLTTRLNAVFKIVKTGRVHRALTKNVSGVGLCVIMSEVHPQGTELDVEVQLPDRTTPIHFTASVVWTKELNPSRKSYEAPIVETGIRFVQIDPKDQKLLVQYATLNASPSEDSGQ